MRSTRKLAMLSAAALVALVAGSVHITRADDTADLSAVKDYVVKQSTALKNSSADLAKQGDAFYDLANTVKFDYAALWSSNKSDVVEILQAAQQDWITLNGQYESMEGIVAGVPFLTDFDPILDSGVKGQVNLDVKLLSGKTLAKPGNLMALTQQTLWGTDATFIKDMKADFDGSGTIDFGEAMPDAIYLKGFSDSLAEQTALLYQKAKSWQPTETDVFTALVINVPTMSDFFNSWKESRFVMGDKATRTDFAVTSRLSDIHNNVDSWQVMWQGLSPHIADELGDLKGYIDNLYQQENSGKRFTPEEADLFSSEAQGRATTIVGQITQVAAEINVTLPDNQ